MFNLPNNCAMNSMNSGYNPYGQMAQPMWQQPMQQQMQQPMWQQQLQQPMQQPMWQQQMQQPMQQQMQQPMQSVYMGNVPLNQMPNTGQFPMMSQTPMQQPLFTNDSMFGMRSIKKK